MGCEEFLDTVRAAGWASTPIPALSAGLKSLRALPARANQPKVLVLVTDGDFCTGTIGKTANAIDTASVLKWLRSNNADKAIRINLVIIGPDRPEAEEAMKKIASESGGEYRFIERK